jgi:hypothetical protein
MRKRISVSSPGIDVDVEVACKGKRRSGLVSIEASIGDPVPSRFFFRDLDGNRFLIVQSECSVPRFRARCCSGAWCGRPSRDASGYSDRRWKNVPAVYDRFGTTTGEGPHRPRLRVANSPLETDLSDVCACLVVTKRLRELITWKGLVDDGFDVIRLDRTNHRHLVLA